VLETVTTKGQVTIPKRLRAGYCGGVFVQRRQRGGVAFAASDRHGNAKKHRFDKAKVLADVG
jgi:hypothetical protein